MVSLLQMGALQGLSVCPVLAPPLTSAVPWGELVLDDMGFRCIVSGPSGRGLCSDDTPPASWHGFPPLARRCGGLLLQLLHV